MELLKIGTLAFATSILTACGGGNSERQPILGPGATEAEADAAVASIQTEVGDVFTAEGITEYAALPSGSATYTGLIYSTGRGFGSGPELDYTADLNVTVQFDSDAVAGKISNFVTSLPDFNNPAGTIDVDGDVLDNAPDARIVFGGKGVLTGTNGVTAEYLVSGDGEIGGTDASVMAGGHITNFEWLSGPDAETRSLYEGDFGATRD